MPGSSCQEGLVLGRAQGRQGMMVTVHSSLLRGQMRMLERAADVRAGVSLHAAPDGGNYC